MAEVVLVGLNKELLEALKKYVKSSNTHYLTDVIKKMVIEFFRSPRELELVYVERPQYAALRIYISLPSDVYEELKRYAIEHDVSMAGVVRAIVAERLGIKKQTGKKSRKKRTVSSGFVVVTFKIEKDLLAKLDLMAINSKMSRSEMLRKAVKLFVNGEPCTTVAKELRQPA